MGTTNRIPEVNRKEAGSGQHRVLDIKTGLFTDRFGFQIDLSFGLDRVVFRTIGRAVLRLVTTWEENVTSVK